MQRLTYHIFLTVCTAIFAFHFLSPQTFGQESKVPQSLKKLRKDFKDGLKSSLGDESIKKGFSKKGLKVMKMVMDRSISDGKVVERSISYLRKIYVKSIRKKYNKDGKVNVKKLKSKGLEVIDLPYCILILRGKVDPLLEYQRLTDKWMSAKDFKMFVSAMTSSNKGNWKEAWFASDLLEFHLERVISLDKRWNFRDTYLYSGKKPDISSLSPLPYPSSVTGIAGKEHSTILIGDLIMLKKYYGDRKKYKHFVFNYPIFSFSRLQAAEASGFYSVEELADLYIKYASTLIESTENRKRFYERVKGRLPTETASLLEKQKRKLNSKRYK